MTERIKALRKRFIEEKAHRLSRSDWAGDVGAYREASLSDHRRCALRTVASLEAETPAIEAEERIVFTRTVRALPPIYSEAEWKAISEKHYIHELGNVSNLSPDYASVIRDGLNARLALLGEGEWQDSARLAAGAVLRLTERYRDLAEELGRGDIAETLARVPAHGARGFREALQALRILQFAMWCEGDYHNTLGRFDQYMRPYFERDIASGALDEDGALELIEEFFLSLNRDSDLYPGMQQGDNGQSLMLGGLTPEGADGYNKLSELCLRASMELNVIDPKLNLRVTKDTPLDTYILGTNLTKRALGFPQYENDDVVIPGLVALGYDERDARDYAVAACWEFIIPGKGMEIPNIGAVSLAKVVDSALRARLKDGMAAVADEARALIAREAAAISESVKNLYVIPSPYLSLFFEGCAESGRDISLGCKYNNYGLHGVGLATAADSLAAAEEMTEKRGLAPEKLFSALDADFEGCDELKYALREECPKMGFDDERADKWAKFLLEAFAEAVKGLKNERGGIYRAGTGSAMYYVWHAKELGATADGRTADEPLPANYAPALHARVPGPASVMRSFAKPDLKNVINGGPLTLEFHDTVFRGEEAIAKVAMLVKSYMDAGGSQLQLNAVNRDRLLDAQKHPENYASLIVRVWGWSGYFVELDRCYQDHIIRRAELMA